jgi:hypothetical protein
MINYGVIGRLDRLDISANNNSNYNNGFRD